MGMLTSIEQPRRCQRRRCGHHGRWSAGPNVAGDAVFGGRGYAGDVRVDVVGHRVARPRLAITHADRLWSGMAVSLLIG
jgi:hypothetical protein